VEKKGMWVNVSSDRKVHGKKDWGVKRKRLQKKGFFGARGKEA